MIECVVHNGNQRKRRRRVHTDAREDDRQSEAGKHDPNVFNISNVSSSYLRDCLSCRGNLGDRLRPKEAKLLIYGWVVLGAMRLDESGCPALVLGGLGFSIFLDHLAQTISTFLPASISGFLFADAHPELPNS